MPPPLSLSGLFRVRQQLAALYPKFFKKFEMGPKLGLRSKTIPEKIRLQVHM